jgi:hypothetical protein
MRPEACPINPGGLEQLFRDGGKIVAEQQRQDRHAKDRMHQHKAPKGAVNAHLAQQDHERIQHDLIGDEGPENQDGEEHIRSLNRQKVSA